MTNAPDINPSLRVARRYPILVLRSPDMSGRDCSRDGATGSNPAGRTVRTYG